jgi:hypothetical protein
MATNATNVHPTFISATFKNIRMPPVPSNLVGTGATKCKTTQECKSKDAFCSSTLQTDLFTVPGTPAKPLFIFCGDSPDTECSQGMCKLK